MGPPYGWRAWGDAPSADPDGMEFSGKLLARGLPSPVSDYESGYPVRRSGRNSRGSFF